MNSHLLVVLILPMHLFLLYSIFDIYFTSPIITQLPTISVTHKPLANRLVLIVIDGLRANKLYENGMITTPFLRRVIMRGNSWGVANTRVPTETRPGHVALIAGFYEDVSSITKGWQENAVEFDSLFNRSSKTWSWGSPDVLPMFQKGAVEGKINTFCYQADFEDFARNRTWELDTWVFDNFQQFMSKIESNSELDNEIRQEGVVIFLHLLGIDVSGHSQKPQSDLYNKNLNIVSQGIENITEIINKFYQDNKTAFVVTSDHGMTNWGSHGAGSFDETTIPVITWGSGFYNSKSSIHKLERSSEESYLSEFGLLMSEIYSESLQSDIMQADLCVLMASMLGVPIPINSVGVIPIDYVDANDSVKAEILRTNILQLFIQYEAKYNQKMESNVFIVREFGELPIKKAHEELNRATKLISEKQFKAVIKLYRGLSRKILDGITYFHKYDRLWLGFLFSSSFILWILLLATHIVPTPTVKEYSCQMNHYSSLAVLILIFFILFFVEQQPVSYLLYQIVPTVLLWSLMVFRQSQIRSIFMLIRENLMFFFGVIVLIESIVWSFFYRQVLSFGLLVVYLIILINTRNVINFLVQLKWTLCCGLLMIYPLLPVIAGHRNHYLVFIGSIFNCSLICYVFFNQKKSSILTKQAVWIKIVLLLASIITAFHVFYCQSKIHSGNGLSWISQYVTWIIFSSLIPIIFSSCVNVNDRVDLLLGALVIIYNLMSIYYELIFLFSLILFSITWKDIELKYRSSHFSSSVIDKRKIIQTVVYVFLLTYSFFATGNIASINSFDVVSTYCFLTVFKPFLMGFILITKIMIPMLAISLIYVFVQNQQSDNINFSTFGPLLSVSSLNIKEIFLVTIISDFGALHFLFLIKDYGSWLEIGTSISHYVITMCISICAFLFTLLAKYLLSVKILPQDFCEIKLK